MIEALALQQFSRGVRSNDIVRNNLLTQRGYSPYCGNSNCRKMPRTHFNGLQFYCSSCGWVSQFPEDFIAEYKQKWGL